MITTPLDVGILFLLGLGFMLAAILVVPFSSSGEEMSDAGCGAMMGLGLATLVLVIVAAGIWCAQHLAVVP